MHNYIQVAKSNLEPAKYQSLLIDKRNVLLNTIIDYFYCLDESNICNFYMKFFDF